jgi:peptidoglycan/LPS O-acetylase OafA/YrhL
MDSKGMIDSLTSLRFFAAFAIVLHHAKGLVFSSEFMKGVPLSSGVSFFFVLSLSWVERKRVKIQLH